MEVQYLNYNGDYELFLSANLTGGNVVLSDSKLYDWMKGTYEIPENALWVDLFDHEVKPISEISGWPGGRAITEVRLVTGVRGNMVDTPINEDGTVMSGSVGGRQIARMCENIIFPEYHNIARFILDEVPRNSFNIPLHKIYHDLSGEIWNSFINNTEEIQND